MDPVEYDLWRTAREIERLLAYPANLLSKHQGEIDELLAHATELAERAKMKDAA